MKTLIRWFAVAVLVFGATHAVAAPATGKPIVAVYQMDDLAKTGQAATFSAMIQTAIEGTSKFRVIERARLDVLLKEQGKAKAGLVTTNTPGRMGGFEGVDFLIYGSITTVSLTNKSDFGTSFVMGMLTPQGQGAPSCANTYATLGIDIKITDARTGEVRYVTRISETQKSASACGGGPGQIDTSLLLRAAADKVASGLVQAIFPIQIASVQDDGVVILNYGEGSLQIGNILTVYQKGEAIRDPASGEILGTSESKLGFVRVTEVTGRLSKAEPITPFATSPPIGSIVRTATAADVDAITRPKKKRK
jgi:curli biogenesis system outer membrane secretion channel CsgG